MDIYRGFRVAEGEDLLWGDFGDGGMTIRDRGLDPFSNLLHIQGLIGRISVMVGIIEVERSILNHMR
jgi:hypothetical protein